MISSEVNISEIFHLGRQLSIFGAAGGINNGAQAK
jgi:hypothetical protein